MVCPCFLLTTVACNPNNKIGTLSENGIYLTYIPTNASFPNPERRFYKSTGTYLGRGCPGLNQSTLEGYRKDNNISLIYRIFYLHDFREKAISQAALDEIERDFAPVRKSGVKMIVRFAYSNDKDVPDAPLSTILQHLDQLKPVLNRNADIICVVQAGFIGAWGNGTLLPTTCIRPRLASR